MMWFHIFREWIVERILRVKIEKFPDYYNHVLTTAARMIEKREKSRVETFYTQGGKMEVEFRFVENK